MTPFKPFRSAVCAALCLMVVKGGVENEADFHVVIFPTGAHGTSTAGTAWADMLPAAADRAAARQQWPLGGLPRPVLQQIPEYGNAGQRDRDQRTVVEQRPALRGHQRAR